MSEPRVMTGGCQCGAARYSVTVRDDEAYLCHCDMCKRATGGVSIAFKNVKQADLVWERGPDWYRSSPIAERPFCSCCGTPLGFKFLEGSENIDLTVGSFDEPGHFRPTSNFSTETMLGAWSDVRQLKGVRLDEYKPLAERWEKAGGRSGG